MTDSTARASRYSSQAAAPSYHWAPPQKPVSVAIPFTVIEQLERAAVESFRSLSSRGSEIGGLLFGSVQPGSPMVVQIESYQSIECDYSSGPLYRLNAGDMGRLDRAVEQAAAGGLRAVGFYRSHTRKNLALDADDLALFDSRFSEAHHIALLIRPAATRASSAGIFIRENGKVNGEQSCLEFPFRPTPQAPKAPEGLYDAAVAGPRSVNAAPATPRPAARAQIVPIASRREITETAMPDVVPEPEPMPEPPAAPEPPKMVAPAPAPVPAPVAPAPKAEPVAPPVAAAEIVAQPPAPTFIEKAAAKPEPARSEPSEPAVELDDQPKASRKLLWLGIGAVASVLVAGGFVFSSGILHRGPRTVATPQDSSPLSLRVDRNGGDIVLTWNRDSDAVRQASHGTLAISDGPQHENVEMDVAQLRNGSIVYSPLTSDVVFRMEVAGSNQSKTVSESVRVLRTRPSPMPDQPADAAKANPQAPVPVTPDAAPAEEEKPTALAQAVRPFKADSLAQRLRPATTAEMPDTPNLAAPVPTQSGSNNLRDLMSAQAPPPAPTPTPAAAPAPVVSAPAPAAAAPSTERRGGDVQQAVLIKRRDPEYPKIARDSGASGVVELVATIGTDGHVKAVQVVRGHPLLRQPATDAVKAWVYRPTILNGVAVETQTTVLLTFKSPR